MENTNENVTENTNTTYPATPAKKSNKAPLLIGGIAGVLIIGAAVVLLIIIIAVIGIFAFNASKEKKRVAAEKAALEAQISAIEEQIYAIDLNDPYNNEDAIEQAYNTYMALPDTTKREIQNRDSLINAYKQLEKIIADRKEKAQAVDDLIASINYSNWFAEADSTSVAAIAYNQLDDKEKKYITHYDALIEAYEYVSSNPVTIDNSNFTNAFEIKFVAGSKVNYGDSSFELDGFYYDSDDRSIKPTYDYDAHNDYATPVYVYVIPKYKNIYCECSFYINLHQTYNGLGIIDSDEHEYAHQEAIISYNNRDFDIQENCILVENNDAAGGVLDWFGWSVDFDDGFHTMNDFDTSKVEIQVQNGYASY